MDIYTSQDPSLLLVKKSENIITKSPKGTDVKKKSLT